MYQRHGGSCVLLPSGGHDIFEIAPLPGPGVAGGGGGGAQQPVGQPIRPQKVFEVSGVATDDAPLPTR